MANTALSPWAEIDHPESTCMQPRIDGLNGKTIGLFAHFKQHSPVILDEVKRQLLERYPDARFTAFQYPKDTKKIKEDPDFDEKFKEWVAGIDAAIAAYGDAGSCAMYLASNTAYIEILGKPTISLVKKGLVQSAHRGAASEFVPTMRFVEVDLADLSLRPVLDDELIENEIRPAVAPVLDKLVAGLTEPLASEEEAHPIPKDEYVTATYSGNVEQINDIFYRNGWTNGSPIIPPTEEAVNAMLEGTDLPRDYIVGELPPMMGKATVEKIAVNAVMAGCLPTYMPVLVAAVRGMLDKKLNLVGWTCSVQSWVGPLLTLNGPIRKDLDMNVGGNLLSPYKKASSTIACAFELILMNIAGIRPGLEDASTMGSECRFGICIAEDEENSVWNPLQTDFGFSRDDSTITMFWPLQRNKIFGSFDDNTPTNLLKSFCGPTDIGFDPGCAFIITPTAAKKLQDAGYSKEATMDYILEYARHIPTKQYVRWLSGNHHAPKVPIPADETFSLRKYFSKDHMIFIVAGKPTQDFGLAFTGGGDHGGPSCTKIELPKNWGALVDRYKDIVPNYIKY